MKIVDNIGMKEILYRVKNNALYTMQLKANTVLNPKRYHLSKEALKRLRWLYLLYYECGGNVSRSARKIGISRQWLSAIKGVFERNDKNPRSLEPLSKAPHDTSGRNRIAHDIETKIVEVRKKYPSWGKEKISHILKRDYQMTVSPSTANRYMKKHGLISPRLSKKNTLAWKHKKQREGIEGEPKLKVKHRPPKELKDYAPGALIEKDMKFVLKLGKFSNTDKYGARENFNYQHTEIDSFTRIRSLELVETSDSETATVAHREARRSEEAISILGCDV
jgi:hypothetical protein